MMMEAGGFRLVVPTSRRAVFASLCLFLVVSVVLLVPYTTSNSVSQFISLGNDDDVTAGDQSEYRNPVTKVIFLKTHKTGSTTTSAIFQRFALSRGLRYATPVGNYPFIQTRPFSARMVNSPPLHWCKAGAFDMMANHYVYDRDSMSRLVPDAKYVTILREPAGQFESAFGYYGWQRRLGIQAGTSAEAIAAFLNDTDTYCDLADETGVKGKAQFRNGQMTDLGLPEADVDNPDAVRRKIAQLDADFDLVMLTEHYDESLILLRRLLRWDYDDIVYMKQGVRDGGSRAVLDGELKDRIRLWNAADRDLYAHFNRTFWGQVSDYGLDFDSDLTTFRRILSDVFVECVDATQSVDCRLFCPESTAVVIRNPRLKGHAPARCRYLDDPGWKLTNVIRTVNVFDHVLLGYYALSPFSGLTRTIVRVFMNFTGLV